MKTLLKVLVALLVVVLAIAAGALTYLNWGLKEAQGLTVHAADLSGMPDGVYTGTYNNSRWTNTVEMSIAQGKIVDVTVVEDVVFSMEDVKQQLITKVIEKQNIDVDAVSGSTATCRAYLKAMEDALSE